MLYINKNVKPIQGKNETKDLSNDSIDNVTPLRNDDIKIKN